MLIATKHDLETILADPAAHDSALAWLQAVMDERYQYGAGEAWGIVSPNGLTRLGLTTAEAVALGAVDRVVPEPERPAVDLDVLKASACDAIDAEAERRRNLVLTPGAGQMAAYQEKERQARLLQADPNPEEGNYPDIFNEVGITADTVQEVAAVIVAAAEQWRAYGRMVEKARLAGKKAVSQATDLAGVQAARDGVAWP